MDVGSLSEIYRYPVKSMAGEQLTASEIGRAGLPGDRAWAVRDEVRGGIRRGKKIPALMRLSARYLAQPIAGRSTAAQITLPGGICVSTGDDNINSVLDAFPILLMSQQSLASMQSRQDSSRFDVRRFRPNLLVNVSEGRGDFPEQAWAGKRLQIGSVILRAEIACPRCAMTTHGFDDLPKDPPSCAPWSAKTAATWACTPA